ncbi:Bardet-Biedl syndrome 5 -like protein [Trichinella murrelli]|uniref:Bardet-Biedl syndrome 5-like protein n=1 Tax=Trichinella murrelli TaxID=144512 RepID=A0A0V0TAJ9_9BILA|nr:Bardet-Biedl syndrome 5 -like protein [Trichinella murrelli]
MEDEELMPVIKRKRTESNDLDFLTDSEVSSAQSSTVSHNVKLFVLTENPSEPCLMLKWPEKVIMLDCPLNDLQLLSMTPVLLLKSSELINFDFNDAVSGLPTSKFTDVNAADIILVSNFNSALALPFITERSEFQGTVYATEPTVEFARCLMLDMVTYFERAKSATQFFNKFQNREKNRKLTSAPFYTFEDVENCLSKVNIVNYNETVICPGFGHLTPTASGLSIGGCNWVIETCKEKIVYLSSFTCVSTHAKAMAVDKFDNATAIVVGSLNQYPKKNPATVMDEFCTVVANTIAAGGNVLIPSSPCGVTFDLIEYLFARVLSRSPLPNCQVIFISETADTCFAFGNICGEWLCDSKKCRVFQPQEPFVHECEKHDLRSPYIVFASHPSLRVGDAVQFLLLMKDNEKNTIILTDPEFSPNEVLFPYKPISMKVAFCPIDVRMNTVEAVSLLSSLQPKALCLPIQEKNTVENFCNTSEIVNTRYYSTSNICPIPPDHRLVKIKLDPKLASAVTLFDLGCGKSIGRVAGRLILKEIGYYVESDENIEKTVYKNATLTCPSLKVAEQLLQKIDFRASDPSLANSNVEVAYESENAKFSMTKSMTRIFAKLDDLDTIEKLQDVVLQSYRDVRFDVDSKHLKLRNGEFIVDKSHGIEDTKGNRGQKGTLIVTNLRIIWLSHASSKINLTIGFNSITAIRTRTTLSKLVGKTESLYVLTKPGSTRFEFIFSIINQANAKLFASILIVFRAYETSTSYREVKMRTPIIVRETLKLLPLEEQCKRVEGTWNLYSDEGDLGVLIMTNVRVVWFATVNESMNISIPYLHIKSCRIKNSKFGLALVIETSVQSGSNIFGFRIDPQDRLEEVCRQIISLHSMFQVNPVFGVEVVRSQRIVQDDNETITIGLCTEDDIEIDSTGRADSLTAYFACGDPHRKSGEPVYNEELGVAIEALKEGFTLNDLWEIDAD